MSAPNTQPTFAESLADCNHRLDTILRRNVGMTLRTYKTIKALAQLVAVALGFYTISQGGDPTLTFTLVSAILIGPEAVETILPNTDSGNN